MQPNPPLAREFERSENEGARGGRGGKVQSAIQKTKRETAVSQGLNTFVLLMYSHLTREQRYVIYLELQRGTPQKAIAQLIGVSKSTVNREIRRNSTPNGKYVWVKAQDRAMSARSVSPATGDSLPCCDGA